MVHFNCPRRGRPVGTAIKFRVQASGAPGPASLSGATGTMRLPLGPILADTDTRAFFLALMQEVVTVGRAKGVALPAALHLRY